MTPDIEIEINPLALIVAESGVGQQQAAVITERFSEFFANAEEWKTKADALTVTDEAQAAEMKMARVGRLALRNIRISVEHTRKELKEDGLKQGRAIDSVAKALTATIEPIERHLEMQETFAVRAKATRDAEQQAVRTALLAAFPVNPTFFDLVNMPQSAFDELVDSLKIIEATKVEAAAKAEQERLAAIEAQRVTAAAEAAAIEAQRIENTRLRAEAEQREKEAAAERERAAAEQQVAEAKAAAELKAVNDKAAAELRAANEKAASEKAAADAELKKERAAAEAFRREAAAQKQREVDAERVRQNEATAMERQRIAAEKKAKAAPDKVKLLALADRLQAEWLPELATEDARTVLAQVTVLLGKVDAFIKEKAATL